MKKDKAKPVVDERSIRLYARVLRKRFSKKSRSLTLHKRGLTRHRAKQEEDENNPYLRRKVGELVFKRDAHLKENSEENEVEKTQSEVVSGKTDRPSLASPRNRASPENKLPKKTFFRTYEHAKTIENNDMKQPAGQHRNFFYPAAHNNTKSKQNEEKPHVESDHAKSPSSFSIFREEHEQHKHFIKGKAMFADTVVEEKPEGSEITIEAVAEVNRTFRDVLIHTITQVKNVAVLAVTMLLGPLAGMFVSALWSVIFLFALVAASVVAAVIITFFGVLLSVMAVISAIVAEFNQDISNTSALYQYAYSKASSYIEEVNDEATYYDEVICYVNGTETDTPDCSINVDEVYLACIGLNDTASYSDEKLELTDDSEESILDEIIADKDYVYEDEFDDTFDLMYYWIGDGEGGTLKVYFNSWAYTSLKTGIRNSNVLYLIEAASDSEMRTRLGMPEQNIKLKLTSS